MDDFAAVVVLLVEGLGAGAAVAETPAAAEEEAHEGQHQGEQKSGQTESGQFSVVPDELSPMVQRFGQHQSSFVVKTYQACNTMVGRYIV